MILFIINVRNSVYFCSFKQRYNGAGKNHNSSYWNCFELWRLQPEITLYPLRVTAWLFGKKNNITISIRHYFRFNTNTKSISWSSIEQPKYISPIIWNTKNIVQVFFHLFVQIVVTQHLQRFYRYATRWFLNNISNLKRPTAVLVQWLVELRVEDAFWCWNTIHADW